MKLFNSNLILILSISFLAGCASLSRSSSSDHATDAAAHKTWGDTYYTDGNHAPASMSPPGANGKGDGEVIDATHLRTQADYHFALGEAYGLENNTNRAIEEYKLTLVYDPNSPVVHLRLATEYVKKGLVSEATSHAVEAVKNNPNLPEARLLLGGLYSSMKLYPEATEQYRALILIRPDSIDSYLYLGALFAEEGKLDEAMALFESVAKMPKLKAAHVAYYYIGRIHSERKDWKKAEQYFQKSIQIKPDFVDATMSLGALYEKLEQPAKEQKLFETFQDKYGPNERVAEPLARMYMAKEDYGNAYKEYEIMVANDSSNMNAKVKMALIMIEKKDYPRAIAHLQDILVIAPDSDKIRFYLGAVYEQTKNSQGAMEQYAFIPSTSSFYEEGVTHEAFLAKQLGQAEKAESIVREALAKRPDVAQFYTLSASLLDEKKQYDEALKVMKTATTKFPDNDQLFFFLGTFYDKVGDKTNTIAALKKSISLSKDNVQALNYLSYTYADMGQNLEEAEALAKRAVDLKKDDPYFRDTLGWVYFKQGRYAEAVRELEFAFKIKSDESVIAEHLGDVYYAFQLVAKAREMYKTAVKLETDVSNAKKIRSKMESLDQVHAGEARLPASL